MYRMYHKVDGWRICCRAFCAFVIVRGVRGLHSFNLFARPKTKDERPKTKYQRTRTKGPMPKNKDQRPFRTNRASFIPYDTLSRRVREQTYLTTSYDTLHHSASLKRKGTATSKGHLYKKKVGRRLGKHTPPTLGSAGVEYLSSTEASIAKADGVSPSSENYKYRCPTWYFEVPKSTTTYPKANSIIMWAICWLHLPSGTW